MNIIGLLEKIRERILKLGYEDRPEQSKNTYLSAASSSISLILARHFINHPGEFGFIWRPNVIIGFTSKWL